MDKTDIQIEIDNEGQQAERDELRGCKTATKAVVESTSDLQQAMREALTSAPALPMSEDRQTSSLEAIESNKQSTVSSTVLRGK